MDKPGFVLVPTTPNRAMERVMAEEDWQWSDVLAAAGTATEHEIAAPTPAVEGLSAQTGAALEAQDRDAAIQYIIDRLQMDIDDGSRPDQWSMEDMARKARAALSGGRRE